MNKKTKLRGELDPNDVLLETVPEANSSGAKRSVDDRDKSNQPEQPR